MIARLKRYLYLKFGYKEKDFIDGRPVKIKMVNKWMDDSAGSNAYYLTYFGFPEKWRNRKDVVLLEEQEFMYVITSVINRVFEHKENKECEIEFVNRHGFHCVVQFKKQHKTLQICDVESIVSFLTYIMLLLTCNVTIINVIFAERKLAVERYSEILEDDE